MAILASDWLYSSRHGINHGILSHSLNTSGIFRATEWCFLLILQLKKIPTFQNPLDPVVQRVDKSYPRVNHIIPRIIFILGLNCNARSHDKFILWIKSANPGITLTSDQAGLSLYPIVSLLWNTTENSFLVIQFFSNNISASVIIAFLSQEMENIKK